MKNRTATYTLLLGITLLLFMAAIVISTSVLFLFGVPVSAFSFWLSVAVAFICLLGAIYTFVPVFRGRWIAWTLAGLLVIAGLCWYVSATTYDLSFDGQTYHQEAIMLLAQGWNPVLDPPLLSPSQEEIAKMDGKEILTAFYLWINHYAKGPWLLDAVMYKVTNQIELGKMFNLLLLFSSFLLSVAAMLAAYPQKKTRAVLISLLLACNPVVICQATSYYIDGQLGSLILIICALGVLLFKRYHGWVLAALCAALMLLAEVKFTALVYAMLLGGGIFLLFLFYDKQRRWKRLLAAFVASFVLAVAVVGYNPYVTNTLTKGHPFYPLAGPHAVDIMTYNSPHDFRGISSIEKLAISLFAKSANIAGKDETSLKFPFTITSAELKVFNAPDVRVAGFGPLFGGAFLLLLIVLVAVLAGDRRKAAPLLLICGILFASVLVNPESWWARYVPQLWMIPVLVAIAGLESRNTFSRNASWVLLGVLLINMVMVNGAHISGQSWVNEAAKQQLADIKASKKTVLIDFHHFNSNRLRLQEAGIPYVEGKIDDKDANAKGLVASRARYVLK